MPRRDNCRVCGEKRLVRFLDLGETPLANRFLREVPPKEPEPTFSLDLFFCPTCTQVQLGEVVPPEVMFRDYIYVTGTSATMPKHFGKMAHKLLQRFFAGGTPFVVEAGSNDGTLLSAFQSEGAKVLGIEPASNITKLAVEKGIETKNDFFSEAIAREIVETRGHAQVIVGCNVFAHIDNLDDVMRGVKALLAPEGVFVIEVPYLFDMISRVEFDTIYHEHLSYFSVTALDTLFARHDLVLFDVEKYEIHGGTIRCFAQHKNGPHSFKDSGAYLTKEKQRGVFDRSLYFNFAAHVEKLRGELVKLLEDLVSKGHTIAGYGSPAKGNTLLNYMKIGPDKVRFLVDKNPMKQGLFTPGMHLPVYPTERLLQEKPDYTLILAWNFVEEIISQQREYIDAGGHFIVPVPEPKIIS